jgi:hypothetical protein
VGDLPDRIAEPVKPGPLMLSLSKHLRSLGAVTLLAACSQQPATPVRAEAADGADAIDCRVGGAETFAPVCAVERSQKDGTLTLVVRHPDGAFRRFDVLKDGRGLAVADGATQAVSRLGNGFAELAVGSDAYRFPVTVGQKDGIRDAEKR